MSVKQYSSSNGYTGRIYPDNFFGFEHYDLEIFETESGKVMYHATRESDMSFEELKQEVEEFPDFYKAITNRRK